MDSQSAPADAEENERVEEDHPSATPEHSESSVTSKDKNSRKTPRPRAVRTNSRQPTSFSIYQSARWAGLPKDVKFYLRYHRESLSHYHYAMKYDGGDFWKTTFLEIALNDSSPALLYAILSFSAYHHSLAQDSSLSPFLTYYNSSIVSLQQSLANKRHTVSTLLTILQLATIEVKHHPGSSNDHSID